MMKTLKKVEPRIEYGEPREEGGMIVRKVTGTLPPHDLEAEAAVLAAIFADGTKALDKVTDNLKPEHFYSDANGRIFEAMVRLSAKGSPVDLLTVTSELRATERLASIGGVSYLKQIDNETPYRVHVEAYAKLVIDRARMRALIRFCQTTGAHGYERVDDVDAFLDAAETALHAVATDSRIDTVPPTLNEAIRGSIDEMLSEAPRAGGVVTELEDLDRLMGPMLPGDLVYVAAHSGVGKTSLGMQLVIAASRQRLVQGTDARSRGVLAFSAEMTLDQLGTRTALSMLSIDTSAAARKRLTDENKHALDHLDTKLKTSLWFRNVWIRDVPNLTPSMIRRDARRVFALAKRQSTPLGFILVDYLQLVGADEPEGRGGDERHERQLAKVSASMKALAKELGLVVVVLAQLNEDARTQNRLPRGEDLRGSRSMRMDADKLILLHNPSAIARRGERRMGAVVDREVAPEVVDLILDKNRGGAEGRIAVMFHPALSTFATITPERLARHIEQENAAMARAAAGKNSR
jgi:replicative DNA helicase